MSEPKRRLRACVEAWPECEPMAYNPACCRFPKSCSCTGYRPGEVTDDDLEPTPVRPDVPAPSDAASVAEQIAALGGATNTEWGVLYEASADLVIFEPVEFEDEARAQVAASPTDTALVSRQVTEWRAAE